MNDNPNAASNSDRPTLGKLVPVGRSVPATRDPYGPLDGYGGRGPDGEADLRLTLLEYWRIVNKRKWVIASILGAFLVLGTLRTLMETPLYTATTRLQIDRNVPVHVLNELVKQVPEGIYITAVKQEGQLLNVAGIAQTQERVSELLRNTAYNSEWLVKPELIESKAATIQAANKEQKRLFDFSVRLTIKRPQDAPASQAAGVAAAIPAAASAPASAAVVAKKA